MNVLSNRPRHLWEIYKNFEDGRWHLPAHQRQLCWDDKKIQEWFDDLIQNYKNGGGEVPGCIIIYKLPEDNKTYLNDGAQRAYWTIEKFINYCKENKLEYKDILMSVQITVQEVDYKNVQEAVRNFIRINFGTAATPYELTRTLFCSSLDDFVSFWEPKMQKVHEAVKNALVSLSCEVEDRKKPEQRELSHKRMRDEMHMFWKFISEDASQWSPQVALTTLRSDKWDDQTKLEHRLLDEMNKLGHSGFDEAIQKFSNFIEKQAGFYKQIWDETRPSLERPANVHFRWWLSVSIYCRNNKVPLEDIRHFTKRLIEHSEGRTTLFYVNKEGKQCNGNTAMSKLQQIGMVSNILEVTLRKKPGRSVSPILAKKGFVKSHVKAHSHHGEGTVLIENAVENAHRSARDMTDEEINRLESLNC